MGTSTVGGDDDSRFLPDNPSLDDIAALAGHKSQDVSIGDDDDDIPDLDVDLTEEDEIEVVDDTPEADKGKVAAPVDSNYDDDDEVTEEELKSIQSASIRARISKLTRQRHEERRSKEEISRQHAEALAFAKANYEQAQRLRDQLKQANEGVSKLSETGAKAAVASAKAAYRDAVEAGDADAMANANVELQQAIINEARSRVRAPEPEAPLPAPSLEQHDPLLSKWTTTNADWWQKDKRLTAAAMAVHQEAVTEKGLTPSTKKYYDYIDANMKPLLSASGFGTQPPVRDTVDPPKPRQPQAVAPVSRSSSRQRPSTASSKKITLTASQVQNAKDLGVPLKDYAKQLAASSDN